MAKPITIKITGDAKGFEKTLGDVDSRLGKFGKTAGKALGAASIAVGAAGLAAGAALYSIATNFDDAFDTIAVGTGATGEALAGLEDDFKAIASNIPGDMGQAADAVAILNTNLATSGEVLQDLGTNVLEASRLLGEDGVANAEAFSRSLNTFGIDAEDGAGKLDALFVATQKYGVGLDGLTSNLQKFGPVLNNAGFSMEESAALFGMLEKGGIQVTRVMPGLNKAFRDWAGEGKNAREELEKVVDQIANTTDSQEALTIATGVFGAEGAQRMTTAIRENIISLDDLETALAGADGSIAATAAQTDSLGEKFGRFKNQMFVALEPIATKLFDAIGKAFEKAAPYIEAFMLNAADWIENTAVPAFNQMMEVVSSIVAWVVDNWPTISDTFDKVAAVIEEVVDRIVDAIGWFVDTFKSGTADAEGEGSKLMTLFDNVWTAVKAAFEAIQNIIQTVVAAVTFVWSRWGEDITAVVAKAIGFILDFLNGMVTALTGIFEFITAVLTGEWGAAWEAIKTILSGAWDAMKAQVALAFEVIRVTIYAVLEAVKLLFSGAIGILATAWDSFWSTLAAPIDAIAGAVGTAASAVWSAVSGPFETTLETLGGLWSAFWNGLKAGIDGVKDGIAAAIAPIVAAIDKITGAIDRVVGAWDKLKGLADRSIDLSGVISAGAGSVPRVMGGPASGMVRVGERGPENLVLPRGSKVIPNHAAPSGGDVYVNVQTNADPYEVGREVAWALKTAGV